MCVYKKTVAISYGSFLNQYYLFLFHCIFNHLFHLSFLAAALERPHVLRQDEIYRHTEADCKNEPVQNAFPQRCFRCERVFRLDDRILRYARQCGTELGVDDESLVQSPAIGIQHRREIAFAQFQPCHNHART